VTSIEPERIAFDLDIVIHAASLASPKYYGMDPVGTLAANTIGTGKLLELARLKKVDSFLFVSSSEVYGQPAKTPTTEQDYGYLDPLNVRSCYAESKRMGENMCVAWNHQFLVPAKVVRPFHTYGPGMSLDDGRVYADFVRNVLDREAIVLNSSGLARRAFCYLADAVEGLFKVLIHGKNGEAYNLGNDRGEISIVELAQMLQKVYSGRVSSISINAPVVDGYITSNVNRVCPDIKKIESLGWKPRLSVKDGFVRTIESYINEP
jgi:nucleoside-diphosphate-sugar epimerase